MRTLLASLTLLACLAPGLSAQAENRMFIIGNDSSGYGVDRCLATGSKCGAAAANAYCQTQQFAAAASYRKVDRDDITGAIPVSSGGACTGSNCEEIVAIVCQR